VRIVGIQHAPADDAELIRNIAEGRLASLGDLFDRYHLPVRRFLARLQVVASDLDDLVQLTFMQVPGAARRFDPARSAKAWIFGLAMIVVKRHRRSLGRFARKLAALAKEPERRGPPTPAELVVDEESGRRAQRALAKLSPKKREVFVMVVMEQLPGEAVAQTLGIPVGAVWTRLHHARRELRELFEGQERQEGAR
jgi:RNA polymerase sigma factor (sigma-70 family)